MTISQIQNRTAIKNNYIGISDATAKMYIGKDMGQGLQFNLSDVRHFILNGDFDNFITVSLAGENDCFGPNIKPSRKALNRLMKLINGTNYRIIQQNGQTFTIEGLN